MPRKLAQEGAAIDPEASRPYCSPYDLYGYRGAKDYIKGYTATSFGLRLFKFDYCIDKS